MPVTEKGTIGCSHHRQGYADTVITALDLDGNAQWQVKNGAAWTKDHPGTRATPTLDADHLYHQSPIGNLVCLNAKAGERIWELNTLEKFGSKPPRWALCESLLIDGDEGKSWPHPTSDRIPAIDSPRPARYRTKGQMITLFWRNTS